ncbi:MAG: nucleoside deaminase [Candidatus Peregrinibacteria bacterium]
MTSHQKFMQRALDLAVRSAKKGTGPFGCVVVKNGKVIAEGWNQVTQLFDPTAHAEVQAIRKACKALKDYQLTGCTLYASSFPCPQCLGAIYWARPKEVYYLNTADQAAKIGFDDRFIYSEFTKPNARRKYPLKRLSLPHALAAFEAWEKNPSKKVY